MGIRRHKGNLATALFHGTAKGLESHQIYPGADLSKLSPTIRTEPGLITKETPVAAMGSCFATRLAEWLIGSGYQFVQTEPTPLSISTRKNSGDEPLSNWNQSAQTGVVYNIGSARHRIELALGRFRPTEGFFTTKDTLEDPYRASIGWPDKRTMEEDLPRHAEAIRHAVCKADVFVLTCGLAEVWKNRIDGTTLAQRPPTACLNPDRHEFTLSTIEENLTNLRVFHDGLRELNPSIRFILTLSPVPLIATFRDEHAVVADTVSKAILRVAIEEFCRERPEVIYFPSYEIVRVMSDRPFERDNRHVRGEIVHRIMSTFMSAYGPEGASKELVGKWRVQSEPASLEYSFRLLYLQEVWRRVAGETGRQPVAIYGGGRHTRMLLDAMREVTPKPLIELILDDAAQPGATLKGIPVAAPEEADPTKFAAVIVSSDAQESQLTERAMGWAASAPETSRPKIERLYAEMPPGPYSPADRIDWSIAAA